MLCHPAGLRIWRWFLELARTRGKSTIIVSSMAGSQVINEPAPFAYTEIAAWAMTTGRHPSPWEIQQIIYMDAAWLAAYGNGKGQAKQGQGLGEYCKGKDLAECRQQFGDALPRICSTCPS